MGIDKKHGGDLYVYNILLITILFASFAANSANKSSQHATIKSAFSDTQVLPSKKEKQIANNFKELYKLSKKNIINKKLFFKLYKDMRKYSVFAPYKKWPKEVLKITKQRNINTIKKSCVKHANSKSTDHIQIELNSNLSKLCFSHYLKTLNRYSNKNYKFHKQQAHFISLNTNHILNSKNQYDLKLFLSSLKSNGSIHKLYSTKIINYYQAKKIAPPKEILKYLYITAQQTRFLQTLDLQKYNTRHVFYKEFKKLKDIAFKTVDNKDATKEEITRTFNQALNYLNLTYSYQPEERALLTLLSISKSLMRRGHYQLARKGYDKILNQNSFHYETTLFEKMWSYVSEEEYENALQVVSKVSNDTIFLEKESKIHFWIGYLNQKIGNSKIAHNVFKEVIKNNPLSYYSILSSKLLSEDLNKSTDEVYLSSLPRTESRKIAARHIDKNWLKRITLWGIVHNPKFLNLELKNKKDSKKDNLQEHILSAAYNLSINGQYLESFKVIYKSINSRDIYLTENTLKILFPKPYLNQIKKNTKSFDPIIALSLIRQESGFNTRAQSHVGARGLMQLMPNTARQFRKRLKTRHLYNPNLNIRIGTKYFNNLLDRYNNNLVYSLAAYNAGERRVNEWQEDYLNSDFMLENIENIPFLETRKYVKLIFRNIFFYKMILSKNNTDSEKLNKIYDIHLGFES